jgi:hypothetical protein
MRSPAANEEEKQSVFPRKKALGRRIVLEAPGAVTARSSVRGASANGGAVSAERRGGGSGASGPRFDDLKDGHDLCRRRQANGSICVYSSPPSPAEKRCRLERVAQAKRCWWGKGWRGPSSGDVGREGLPPDWK